MNTWEDVVARSKMLLSERTTDQRYHDRLAFELSEIDKQGANAYWLGLVTSEKKFKSNPNMLVLPWVLGMVDQDPIASRNDPMLCTVKASVVKAHREMHGSIPCDIIKDQDMPDIDLDCLPEARDPIKEYAMAKYGVGLNEDGYGPVCSVGTWQTYKFKSAIMDVSRALEAVNQSEVYELTTKLPEDVDNLKDGGYAACKARVIDHETNNDKECGHVHNLAACPSCGSTDTETPTIGALLLEHENLAAFERKYPIVIEYAVKLVGRIRNMGMHAGALIIADRSLYGNIPLAKSSSRGYWVSMWTEGRNTQLSKFGYCKWDVLGLKTLEYIFRCSKLIEQNRGISFGENAEGWNDINPLLNRAGHYYDGSGEKQYILLNDEHALRLANEQKTDAVFQFDTDLAKSILSHGVRHFNDLMLLNAMGHPGPMASIPDAVANRDDVHNRWKLRLHPEILAVLEDTYGVIVYQEQLQALWQRLAGFTAPEAQEARKAVAKKWTHKLKPIRQKWLDGASNILGKQEAEDWWTKMETFGRYAFNRSHAVAYCLMAYRCLWLKAHFAPEFWAAVMSDCHPDKLVRYMSVARAEDWKPTDITYSGTYKPKQWASGVKFGTLNINNLTVNYTVTGDVVNQGLIGIKKVGEKAAELFEGKGDYKDIDEFVNSGEGKKNKTALERFIKLGSFSFLPGHENAKAVWMYYQYKYCSGNTDLKKQIRQLLLQKEGWDEKTVLAERMRQSAEFKKAFPKKKVPPKILNWSPKPDDSRARIMALYSEDFTKGEKLEFQKEFLGYYLDSPLDLFILKGDSTIKHAKAYGEEGEDVSLEVMILEHAVLTTKPKEGREQSQYLKLTVTDGIQRAFVFVWTNEFARQDPEIIQAGVGVRMRVSYDKARNSFTMCRNTNMIRLKLKA